MSTKVPVGSRFHFFWHGSSPFSQWHPSVFTGQSDYGGKVERFANAEQWMMYNKAVLFGDMKMAKVILATPDPRKVKGLGRKVRGFKEAVWKRERLPIVRKGNYLKFSQNPALWKALDSAIGDPVEASPVDRIWGIGLRASDPRALDPKTWRGLNLLGIALVDVREMIRKESSGEEANGGAFAEKKQSA
jgi:ribA/ribD-fused uncharacterized protein